jgi:hypothetical protein
MGSMVPVALMVAATSPCFTTAVRKDSLWSFRTHHHPTPAPPSKMMMTIARTGLVRKRCMESAICQQGFNSDIFALYSKINQ